MLAALAGQTHEVLTALVVRQLPSPAGGADAELVATVTRTHVTFRPLAPDAIAAYVATGEPLDKAGAYGYQGLGACLVAGIHGCYYNVVGLSLSAVLDAFETILRSTPDATT
ncbi:Maf/Ham1 [Caulochytrium protostelioides]|nr:Maf/Ham1 [Caulochytrium protostelioides]